MSQAPAVSIGLTSWQLWVSREYKLEEDEQQAEAIRLSTQQLKATLDQNTQLTIASNKLREELAELRKAMPSSNMVEEPTEPKSSKGRSGHTADDKKRPL